MIIKENKDKVSQLQDENYWLRKMVKQLRNELTKALDANIRLRQDNARKGEG